MLAKLRAPEVYGQVQADQAIKRAQEKDLHRVREWQKVRPSACALPGTGSTRPDQGDQLCSLKGIRWQYFAA